MPISQADLQVISTVFGKNIDEISGALSSQEEVSLGLRLNGKVLTQEEQKLLKETAVQQGKEISAKELAKALELELAPGEKEATIIAEKLKAQLSGILEEKYKTRTPSDEQIELAKKAVEWEDKYKKLFDTHKTIEQDLTSWKEKYTQKERAIEEEKLSNKILSLFPADMDMDKSDALLITKSVIAFDKDENGNTVCKYDGKLITNAVGEPEPIENVIPWLVDKKKWIKTQGMGGGDRNPDNPGGRSNYSPDEARNILIASNIAPTSQEGLKKFAAMTKDFK